MLFDFFRRLSQLLLAAFNLNRLYASYNIILVILPGGWNPLSATTIVIECVSIYLNLGSLYSLSLTNSIDFFKCPFPYSKLLSYLSQSIYNSATSVTISYYFYFNIFSSLGGAPIEISFRSIISIGLGFFPLRYVELNPAVPTATIILQLPAAPIQQPSNSFRESIFGCFSRCLLR